MSTCLKTAPEPAFTSADMPRSRLSGLRRFETAIVAMTIAATLFASSVPTPLYHVYEDRWHFSSVILTLIYATYALAALSALLVVGRISDDVGRRPVLAVGLGGLMASAVIFALADSILWLFLARAVQGVATGLVLGTAGATLIDLHARNQRTNPGLTNGVASAFGLAAGAPIAAILVQYVPLPRVVPFVLEGILCAALMLALLGLHETASSVVHRYRLRPTPPRVPPAAQGAFIVAALAALSSWSVAALLLSLGPELAAKLVGTKSPLPGGWATLAFAGAAGSAQLLAHRLSDRAATTCGSLLLACGMATTIASLDGNAALFFVGLVAAGAGFGLLFMGGVRALTAAAPLEHRATVMSAFYVAAYLSLSLPAVFAGLIATHVGIVKTYRAFGIAVIVVALIVGAIAARLQRPVLLGSTDASCNLPEDAVHSAVGSPIVEGQGRSHRNTPEDVDTADMPMTALSTSTSGRK